MSACCSTDCHPRMCSRRVLLGYGLAAATLAIPVGRAIADSRASLPKEVAGIRLPGSAIALRAATFSKANCPRYLYNHCVRTFLFGAKFVAAQGLAYDADEAFVAAVMHDVGLLAPFASKAQSFEVDGAERAEKLALNAGMATSGANVVWESIALHDGRWALAKRAGPEAMLVAAGAAADVVGPEAANLDMRFVSEIVSAYPRLQFKRHFTALLIDHCKRKPQSQAGTWLESLCREQAPSAFSSSIEKQIAGSSFPE